MIFICALNEDWTPNWSDPNESKYYPYFDMDKKPPALKQSSGIIKKSTGRGKQSLLAPKWGQKC